MVSSAPGDDLIRTAFTLEVDDAQLLYQGVSLADLAHVVGLVEAGIVPSREGGKLLTALLRIHPTPPADLVFDPALGDVYTNRIAYLRANTPEIGWLGAGRARRETTTIAYRVAVRSRLLELAEALEQWITNGLDQVEVHRNTLFPDYTYLQPAQPTVFGHYLLTFLYPVLRDLDRLRYAFEHTNASPAGSGSVNGSRLPFDRERLAGLLGFDSVIPHTRDAMWQVDGPVEIAALLTAMLVNLDRLAEDLMIFSTAEFDLVELDVAHTRRSVIMPQKKNPYSLAYLRGVAGESIGTLAAMAAVGKTPSGQIDNRMFAHGAIPRALERATGAARLIASVLEGLTVNTKAAGERTGSHFLGATDLAEVLMLERGLDYATAYDIVARAVRSAHDSGEKALNRNLLDSAAKEAIGSELGLPPEVIDAALEPEKIVASRTVRGGAAEERILEMVAECRQRLASHVDWHRATLERLAESESALLAKVDELRIEGI
jgi:argininosuccinate lyase